MNNINELKGKCSGCGACKSVCPVNAINYKLNSEGFYEAFVNDKKCIKCGKCTKICFKNENNLKNIKLINNGELYSAFSKEKEILEKTTSGGIAYEIANWGLENDYYIMGVKYNYKKNIAETIIIKNKSELKEITGSKYLQSKSDSAIAELINNCKEDSKQKFLIFGTPCQIFGIRELIKEKHIKNEIIYIDLFCHGVPSYLIWDRYIKEFKEGKKDEDVKNIEFRNKKYGWGNFVLKIETNKKIYYNKAERDNFFKIFFDNAFLNQSCLTCELRKNKTSSDIRLGDFWHKDFNGNKRGVSAVLLNTEEGHRLIEQISKNIEIKLYENLNSGLEKQSREDIENKIVRENCKADVLKGKKLKEIIKNYQKFQPSSQKIKKKIKYVVSFFPPIIKRYIKKII